MGNKHQLGEKQKIHRWKVSIVALEDLWLVGGRQEELKN